MTSNSQIFTTSVFGNGSGATANELATKDTTTIEKLYGQYPLTKMNILQPTVPSNQGVAKDK